MDKGKAPLIEEEGESSFPTRGSVGSSASPSLTDESGGGLVSNFDIEKFPQIVGTEQPATDQNTENPILAADHEGPKTSQTLGEPSSNKAVVELLASSLGPPSSKSRRKANFDARLAEIALVDPTRARRMILNRQSAARVRERRLKNTLEVGHKVRNLEAQAAALTARLTMLRQYISGLAYDNHQLQFQLQTVQEHARLQTELRNAMQEELFKLRGVTSTHADWNRRHTANFDAASASGTGAQHSNHYNEVMQSFLEQQNHQHLQARSLREQQQVRLWLQQSSFHLQRDEGRSSQNQAEGSSANNSSPKK